MDWINVFVENAKKFTVYRVSWQTQEESKRVPQSKRCKYDNQDGYTSLNVKSYDNNSSSPKIWQSFTKHRWDVAQDQD